MTGGVIISFIPIIIIFISAMMHAMWNYLVKISQGGYSFVWLHLGFSILFLTPFMLILISIQEINIGWIELAYISGSAMLHALYLLMLQKGYKMGDFSVIYPVARGVAPVLVAVLAIFIYGEKLTLFIILGVILISGSVFLLTGGHKLYKRAQSKNGLIYGLLIGLLISSYTLLDKGAVSVVLISPIMFMYGSIIIQFILLTPAMLKQKEAVIHDWKWHKLKALAVGILNPLAYILILFVMILNPVSQIAPLREVSILFGILMGSFLLSEGFGKERVTAGAIMVLGILLITFSNF